MVREERLATFLIRLQGLGASSMLNANEITRERPEMNLGPRSRPSVQSSSPHPLARRPRRSGLTTEQSQFSQSALLRSPDSVNPTGSSGDSFVENCGSGQWVDIV
jgi:hypothetical protein